MKITKETKWVEIFLFVDERILKELKSKITDIFPFDFWQELKISDLSFFFNDEYPPKIEAILKNNEITVFDYIKMINAVESFGAEFSNLLENTTIDTTEDEKMASSGLRELSPFQNVLIFVRSHFGMKNYTTEAVDLPLYDFMLAKLESYNDRLFQKQLNEIQIERVKRK